MAKKCTKKCDACVKLLSNLLLFFTFSRRFLPNDQTLTLWNVIFINYGQFCHVCPCESHATTCAWAAVRLQWGFPHIVLNKNECSRALNASYMFQAPYKFLHPYTEEKAVIIHTLKNVHTKKSSWHPHTKEEAVTLYTKKNNRLPCRHSK